MPGSRERTPTAPPQALVRRGQVDSPVQQAEHGDADDSVLDKPTGPPQPPRQLKGAKRSELTPTPMRGGPPSKGTACPQLPAHLPTCSLLP